MLIKIILLIFFIIYINVTDISSGNMINNPKNIICDIAIGRTNPKIVSNEITEVIINGDFEIQHNESENHDLILGDGQDEITTWGFYLEDHPKWAMLLHTELWLSVKLTLQLKPGEGASPDSIKIGNLPPIEIPEIEQLPIDEVNIVSRDLLVPEGPYTAQQILEVLQAPLYGQLPIVYEDDALIVWAELCFELADSQESNLAIMGAKTEIASNLLTLYGHFGAKSRETALVITLSGRIGNEVKNQILPYDLLTPQEIVVHLPGDLEPAIYRLTFNTLGDNHEVKQKVETLDVIIGDVGPIGPKGDVGPIGPKGDVGPIGPKGDVGSIGPKGDVGSIGLKGDVGSIGLKGDVGSIGPKGDVGSIGPKGDVGSIGPKGDVGSIGPKGDVGSIGPKGDVGSIENVGVLRGSALGKGQSQTDISEFSASLGFTDINKSYQIKKDEQDLGRNRNDLPENNQYSYDIIESLMDEVELIHALIPDLSNDIDRINTIQATVLDTNSSYKNNIPVKNEKNLDMILEEINNINHRMHEIDLLVIKLQEKIDRTDNQPILVTQKTSNIDFISLGEIESRIIHSISLANEELLGSKPPRYKLEFVEVELSLVKEAGASGGVKIPLFSLAVDISGNYSMISTIRRKFKYLPKTEIKISSTDEFGLLPFVKELQSDLARALIELPVVKTRADHEEEFLVKKELSGGISFINAVSLKANGVQKNTHRIKFSFCLSDSMGKCIGS